MIDAMSRWVANLVVNAAWQGSIIVISALISDRVLRSAPARFRHWLLVTALFAAVLVPLLGLIDFAPTTFVRATSASTPMSSSSKGGALHVAIVQSGVNSVVFARAIAFGYCGFVLIAALRLARALRFAVRLRKSAVRTGGAIAFSHDVAAPVTVGVLDPLILLPARRPVVSHALLPALAHEFAHVRRRDPLLQLFVETAMIFAGFNPLAVLLKRRIARTREIACDEMAIGTMDPLRYGRALLTVAQSLTAPRCALAFGDTGDLGERLRALQTPRKRQSLVFAFAALALSAISIALTGCRLQMFDQQSDLSGRWLLNRQQTNFGAIPPYQTFSQSIEQHRGTVKNSQLRKRNGLQETIVWTIRPDGVKRPVCLKGVPGQVVARWSRGRLLIDVVLSNGHVERNTASLANGGTQLICEGMVVERRRGVTRYRMVFDRS